MCLKAAKKRRRDKAVSPAISTVIMTGTMVALITVALGFASNYLVLRMAESEFNAALQFMQTLGLQIDDVAWIIGRTETARYSSNYGSVVFEPALKYTVYIDTGTEDLNQTFYSGTTGIVCFNMPVSQYSLGNNYYTLVYPPTDSGFLSNDASSPIAKVFAVEKLPMADGSFIRVAVMPTIRMLNVTIGDTTFVRLYLPVLSKGETPRRFQSITLTGESVSRKAETVTGIRIALALPLSESGFNQSFFNLSQLEESIPLDEASNIVLELYIGDVDVALGVHA